MTTIFGQYKVVFKSFDCIDLRPEFSKTSCNATSKYLSFRCFLLAPPLKSLILKLSTHKLVNKAYQPFVYNITLDVCAFLKGKKYYVFNLFYNFIKPYSNLNHSCPYNHDVIFDKVPASSITMPSLFSVGEYKLDIYALANGGLKTTHMAITADVQ